MKRIVPGGFVLSDSKLRDLRDSLCEKAVCPREGCSRCVLDLPVKEFRAYLISRLSETSEEE